MKFVSFGISDIGLVRANNEDVWAEIDTIPFYALADGMGGHQAGEVAAKVAVVRLCELADKLFAHPSSDIEKSLKDAVVDANATVYALSSTHEELRGMGTTLSCCVIHNGRLIFAHVGDSRIYQLRGGLKQLTQDHSLRSQLIASGQLESSKAHEFPKKNVITKAVGTTKNLEPDTGSCAIEAGDLYLLCSDGLTDMLSNDEIEQILTQFPLPSEAGPSLIAAAKEKGGTDNITALLVKAIL